MKLGMEIDSIHIYTFCMKYLCQSAVTNMAMIQDKVISSIFLSPGSVILLAGFDLGKVCLGIRDFTSFNPAGLMSVF